MRYWFFGLAVFLISLAGAVFALNFSKLPPELPWFYSLPWGEAMLLPKIWFGLSLLALLGVTGLNFWISSVFSKTDKVVASVVAGATLLLTLVYLASFFRVLAIML